MGGDSESLSTLLCLEQEEEEEEDTVLEEEDELGISGEIDDEYLQILLERESIYGGFQSSSIPIDDDRVKCARLNAISWIIKVREIMGLGYQTAYLSLTYFDRFLSRRVIDSDKQWAIELLSVACLSLAAKMEEYRAPLLGSFPAQGFVFENRFIQRMELLVLSTLEWRLTCVTPFSYLVYFFKKLHRDSSSSSPGDDALSGAGSLILSAIRDSDVIRVHRPSVIAAAATLTVLYQKLTRPDLEAKMDNNGFPLVIEIEELHSCYLKMQEIYTCSNKKRKRLTFEDEDNKSSNQKKG